MKITINRQDFRKAFAVVVSINRSDDPRPHGGVLLSRRNGHFLLTNTKETITLQTKVRAKCDPGPDVLLPCQFAG